MFEDPESVINYREGGKGGKKSEIWFTPVGFFAAFDHSKTLFAKCVRKLKNKFFTLALKNLACRNLVAKENDALLRLKTEENACIRANTELLRTEWTKDSEQKRKKIVIQQVSAFKRILSLCGIPYKHRWMVLTCETRRIFFWRVWHRAKDGNYIRQVRGDKQSNYQINSTTFELFEQGIREIIRQFRREPCFRNLSFD
jgi:hypothetical protein